jgi:hypothetical protein
VQRVWSENEIKPHLTRFVMHFTPTSSSWLNLVERFFAELTGEVVREGSYINLIALFTARTKPLRFVPALQSRSGIEQR